MGGHRAVAVARLRQVQGNTQLPLDSLGWAQDQDWSRWGLGTGWRGSPGRNSILSTNTTERLNEKEAKCWAVDLGSCYCQKLIHVLLLYTDAHKGALAASSSDCG